MRGDILRTKINGLIGAGFVGVFALGAVFIIWHVAYNENPLADALVPYVTPAVGQ